MAQSFAVADRGIWLPPPDALQAACAAGSEQAGVLQARILPAIMHPGSPLKCPTGLLEDTSMMLSRQDGRQS